VPGLESQLKDAKEKAAVAAEAEGRVKKAEAARERAEVDAEKVGTQLCGSFSSCVIAWYFDVQAYVSSIGLSMILGARAKKCRVIFPKCGIFNFCACSLTD